MYAPLPRREPVVCCPPVALRGAAMGGGDHAGACNGRGAAGARARRRRRLVLAVRGNRQASERTGDAVRLLAPFDPVVWDRRRFELFWGWAYRFEAYTPVPKRTLGYYALPLLWRDRVIGWGNLSVKNGRLDTSLGYVSGRPPRERAFRQALEAELAGVREFLGLV